MTRKSSQHRANITSLSDEQDHEQKIQTAESKCTHMTHLSLGIYHTGIARNRKMYRNRNTYHYTLATLTSLWANLIFRNSVPTSQKNCFSVTKSDPLMLFRG
jgi:hypothetical protein